MGLKTFGVVFVWTMAAILAVAVGVTAISDELALRPLTVEEVEQLKESVVKIDLNTATAAELCEIEGLGEVFADRIVAYRETNGAFRSVDDLLDIEGIGEKRLAQWRLYLTVKSTQG